jgi:AraC family transcriptional regulator
MTLGMFETRHRAGTELSSHRHTLPYAAVVIDGEYFESSADGIYWCEPGCVIVHPPLHLHVNRFADRNVRVLNFSLAPSLFRTAPNDFAVVRAHGSVRLVPSQLRTAADVIQLLGECERVSALEPASIGGSAAAMVASHPAVKVGHIALSLGVSREYLSRVFRAQYGMSIARFRSERRLRRTLELLASRRRTLSQVALEAGFSDHAHMTRSVRAAVGRPPSAIQQWLYS